MCGRHKLSPAYGIRSRQPKPYRSPLIERKTEAIGCNLLYIPSPSRSLLETYLLLVIHLDLEGNDWIAVVPQQATSPRFIQLWSQNFIDSLISLQIATPFLHSIKITDRIL